MLEIKKDYMRKTDSLYFFFIITIISFTLAKILDSQSETLFISKLICLCMSIIIFVISIVKTEDDKIKSIKYIGLAFLYISLARFLELETISQIYVSKKYINFYQLLSYLEIINMIAAFMLFKIKASSKVQNIIYILILTTLFIINNGYKFDSIFIINKRLMYLSSSTFKIILLIIYFYLIKSSTRINSNEKKIYIFLGEVFLFPSFIKIISILFRIDLILLIPISKSYIYIMIYRKIEKIVYTNAYTKAKLDLDRSLKKKLDKNKDLRIKEKALFEADKNLKKTEEMYYYLLKNFYDVIIIFDNNNLIYTNYYNKYYDYKLNENNHENIDIDSVLKGLIEDRYEEIRGKEEFSIVTKKKDDYLNDYVLQIELKKIYEDKKILYINDVTDNYNKKEEIISLENKINEEKIKDEFYANISHELRTPINVIYSGLQLNSIYIQNRDINKIKSNNKLIKQNCLRLIRTVNNFIDSNKLSENKIILNKDLYNVVDIIDNIVLVCDYYMKQKNIKLTFDPEVEEVYMICDKNHIERIMLNILSNSLKYGKEYGNIYLTLEVEDENIVIEVMNDAEAIEESKRKIIFEQFTKINNSLSRPSEGCGLGLFLTKGLVELNGGSIEIISGKEIGNIFKMILPYNKEITKDKILINKELEINELKEKVDIEFSDIYFNI